MPALVSLVRQTDYDPLALKASVAQALELIGGLEQMVRPGQRVFLKINQLGVHPAESAINTHPELIRAVVELVREITNDIIVGDDVEKAGTAGFEITGTRRICENLGVKLINLKEHPHREVKRHDYELTTSIPMSVPPLEADVVITLPKLKTHMLCLLTNAVKNNYGFLPHRLKPNYHRQFIRPDEFSNLLVDIYLACKPHLAIVDAVTALEGLGPSRGGKPKQLGLVMAGRDSVAVDAVAAAVMGVDPLTVATTRHAARRKIGKADLAKIEVLGESIDSVRDPFKLPANRLLVESVFAAMPGPLVGLLHKLIESTREYPRILSGRCIGCGLCAKHCPNDAIRIVDRKAVIDFAKCISCFCCQEFCESDAIATRLPVVGRGVQAAGRALRGARRVVRAITGSRRGT